MQTLYIIVLHTQGAKLTPSKRQMPVDFPFGEYISESCPPHWWANVYTKIPNKKNYAEKLTTHTHTHTHAHARLNNAMKLTVLSAPSSAALFTDISYSVKSLAAGLLLATIIKPPLL